MVFIVGAKSAGRGSERVGCCDGRAGWKWRRDSGRCVCKSIVDSVEPAVRCWYLEEFVVVVVDVLGGGDACWFGLPAAVGAAYYSGGASLAGDGRAKFSRTHEKAETRKEPIMQPRGRKNMASGKPGTDRDRVESRAQNEIDTQIQRCGANVTL